MMTKFTFKQRSYLDVQCVLHISIGPIDAIGIYSKEWKE